MDLESILAKLSVPQSEVIAEGTKELRAAFKDPEVTPRLCQVMTTSSDVQIRQYAALLLRKKLGKPSFWAKVPAEAKSVIKQGSLKALVDEPERGVKLSIMQLIAVLARQELRANTWPELPEFLFALLSNPDPGQALMGLYLLSVLAETVGDQVKLWLPKLKPFLTAALQSGEQPDAGFYAIRALTHLVMHVGSDQMKSFQPFVPDVIASLTRLASTDQEKATEAMEIFDELFESEVAIVVPHIQPILDLCLKMSADTNLENPLRVKAVSFLGRLTKMKRKLIVKQKYYVPIIDVLFNIVCTANDDDEDNEDEEEEEDDMNESVRISTCALQALDQMAMNLPPSKFMPQIGPKIVEAFNSGDPVKQRGAFQTLGVIVEGCSESIRKKYMSQFLDFIGQGIRSSHNKVRNSSLYCLGQFSEFLQPDISDYAEHIFPVLLGYLDESCAAMQANPDKKATPKGLDRVFYAVETFCENMEQKLVPFVPQLMTRCMSFLAGEFSVQTRVMSISVIGAIAHAVEGKFVEYFAPTMEYLKGYLTLTVEEDDQDLLTQSLATLCEVARAVGPTGFVPSLAEECCNLGFNLVNKYDDPDVRKCVYSLFDSVAFVVKDKMAPVVPQVAEMLLRALRSKEGISVEFKDEDEGLPVEDLEDEEDITLEDSTAEPGDIKNIHVENAYMNEKFEALVAVKGLATHSTAGFFPYLSECWQECVDLIEYPDEDVRKAALEAVVQITIAYYKSGAADQYKKSIEYAMPTLCTFVKEDEEVQVVCCCLEQITYLLKEIKGGVSSIPGYPEAIVGTVQQVMRSECKCLDVDSDGDSGRGTAVDVDDDEESEQDELLFEYAADVMPSLGLAMTPESFTPYFAGFFPQVLKKYRANSTSAEKAFAAGSLAECMKPLKGMLEPYVPKLVPVFTTLILDESEDVRNNAVFGAGELALYGGEPVYQHYPAIMSTLNTLTTTMAAEKAEMPRVMDQVVSCLCHLLLANKSLVPIPTVLEAVFGNLPLKVDMQECGIVFQALLLPEIFPEVVKSTENVGKVIKMGADMVEAKDVEDDAKAAGKAFFATLQRESPALLTEGVNQLGVGTQIQTLMG